MGEALSLDYNKNNYHPEKKSCHVGYFQGVYHHHDWSYRGVRGNVRCKKWTCDVCRPGLLRKLKARIFNGAMADYFKGNLAKKKYFVKLLTLTVPGAEFRQGSDPELAYKGMTKDYNKLMRALKKKHGNFHYFRVVEPQRDGFPHFHVLLVGRPIAKKSILNDIRDLWTYRYHQGNVDIKIVKDPVHGVRYLLKYLLKDSSGFGLKSRKFTTSQNSLDPVRKKEWMKKEFYVGLHRGRGVDSEMFEIQLPYEDGRGFLEDFMDYVLGGVNKSPI